MNNLDDLFDLMKAPEPKMTEKEGKWNQSLTIKVSMEVAKQIEAIVERTSDEDCMFFKCSNNKSYFIAHGSPGGLIEVYGKMMKPMDVMDFTLVNPDKAEEINLISCYVGKMKLGQTSHGYTISPISKDAINAIQFKLLHYDGVTDLATIDLIFK